MKIAHAATPAEDGLSLASPRELQAAVPLSAGAAAHVTEARDTIARILRGEDRRLLVIAGPCSIHDADAALEYARWMRQAADRYRDRLFLVMRVYVEKARTRLGWKGFLSDPHLDGSARIDVGLRWSRQLLVAINELGVPAAAEILEPATPAYLIDTISWGAIGARTAESPVHRELASSLPCPVGFKNTMDGNVTAAINAAATARQPQRFVGIDADGRAAIVTSAGNAGAHVVLRGGPATNYDAVSVGRAADALAAQGFPPRVIVDCSHGNSRGDFRNQPIVAADVATQIAIGSPAIAGVMLESFLIEGRQVPAPGQPLRYGQSITDACIDLHTTDMILGRLSTALPQEIREKN